MTAAAGALELLQMRKPSRPPTNARKRGNDMTKDDSNLLVRLGVRVAGGLVALILVVWMISGTMITIQADEIVIKQDLVGGQLHVWDTPGPHAVLWGTVTRYKRSAQLWFSAKDDE